MLNIKDLLIGRRLRQVEQLASTARRDERSLAVGLVVWFTVGTDRGKPDHLQRACPTAWRRSCLERCGELEEAVGHAARWRCSATA